jgi:hypothetical protein
MTGYYVRPEVWASVTLTWYVLPLSSDTPNELAAHLGRIDPVYHKLVERAIITASQIAPIMDDEHGAEITLLPDPDYAEFPNHPLLTDLSPTNLVHFAIQHYLMFGRSSTLINVWGCWLKRHDNLRTMLIPWFTSIHVGNAFRQADVSKKSQRVWISGKDVGGRRFEVPRPVRSCAAWNLEARRKLASNERWFVLEWTEQSVRLWTEADRERAPESYASHAVESLKIVSDQAFEVVIDHRVVKNVMKLDIDKMPDVSPSGEPLPNGRLKLRFATFSPPLDEADLAKRE